MKNYGFFQTLVKTRVSNISNFVGGWAYGPDFSVSLLYSQEHLLKELVQHMYNIKKINKLLQMDRFVFST